MARVTIEDCLEKVQNRFELSVAAMKRAKNIYNGGRYDQLISDLGSKKKVPAVGAAINLK